MDNKTEMKPAQGKPSSIKGFAILSVAAALVMMMTVFAPQTRTAGAEAVLPHLETMDDVARAVGSTDAPVLLQFDAKWCGYCRALQPHLQKLREKNLQSELHMYQIDIDKSKELGVEFGVRSLPTIFIVHKGEVVAFKRGGMDEDELFAWVDEVRQKIRKG